MKALVIYDSYFGNTEKVALRIGETLGAEAVKADEVEPSKLEGVDCLIVGSPTRAFRPTKNITSFLKGIPKGSLKDVKVAAFDTRIDPKDVNNAFLNVMVRLFGYADKPIADKLLKKGGTLAVNPEGFFVLDTEGPLRYGELERAAAWAERILVA